MSDELRRAAERLSKSDGAWRIDLENAPLAFLEDVWLLASHYLATHRADDGEVLHGDEIEAAIKQLTGAPSFKTDRGTVLFRLIAEFNITTRGQLRRLVEVLGGGK
jgi:hypothetical protein